MITPAQFQRLKNGGFASIQLANGPLLSGFAAQDTEVARFLRLDGLIENEDGSLSQFALRLELAEIEGADFLDRAPIFTDRAGTQSSMNAEFWQDMD